MSLSTTANVTLGENKMKNKQNNLFDASSRQNTVDRRREIAKTSGKSCMCCAGSERVEVNWGVEAISGGVKVVWDGMGVGEGGTQDAYWQRHI